MKSFKYIISVLSVFAILTVSVFAADQIKYLLKYSYAYVSCSGEEYRDAWTIDGDYIISPTYMTMAAGDPLVSVNYSPFELVPGKVYRLDFEIESKSVNLISSSVTCYLSGTNSGSLASVQIKGTYDPATYKFTGSGIFSIDSVVNDSLGKIRAFSFRMQCSSVPAFYGVSFKVKTELYSDISNSDILSGIQNIEGAINTQTGEITGKIDDATNEILHGYTPPDFSGNQSTVDDYNQKEQQLINGTSEGKNQMESINNNALSFITTKLGAFTACASMMNDFINTSWFTNGLFALSAALGLVAVLIGVAISAIGSAVRRSGNSHSGKKRGGK